MGIEAPCTGRVGRKSSEGTALLEGEVLLFRGDFSLKIPFEDMRDVSQDGIALVIKTADQEAHFEVGAPVAERWVRDHTTRRSPKIRAIMLGPLVRYRWGDVRAFMAGLSTDPS